MLFNEIAQNAMKLNPPTRRRGGFHPTLVGFIPSVRTDLVEKNQRLSTTNVGSFMR